MTIGERIKLRRKELGLTQTELANRMGLTSKTTICKAETADFNPTMDRVREFAKALDTTPGYLLGWEEETEQFRNKLADLQIEYIKAKKSGNKKREKEIADTMNKLNEEHNISFESYVNNAIAYNLTNDAGVDVIVDMGSERQQKALELYEKIEKADPNIREAILSLLKGVQ